MNIVACSATLAANLAAEIVGHDFMYLVIGDATDHEAIAVATMINSRANALIPATLTWSLWWLQGDSSCLNDPSLAAYGLPATADTLALGYGRKHVLAQSIVKADVEDSGAFDPTLVPFPVDLLIVAALAQ